METNRFESKELAENALALQIEKQLLSAIEKHGDARILLSGGSTPKKVYEKLSQKNLPWEKIHIGLVDERYVGLDDENSNEALLQQAFDLAKNPSIQITGLVFDLADKGNNTQQASIANQLFLDRVDIVLLGMGLDGHTASLFPGDMPSESLLNSEEEGIYATHAPTAPVNRITFSKKSLLQAPCLYLYITGEEKHRKLMLAEDESLPIGYFTKEREDLQVFYCN
jgi:6-phosphogluconolactonase